MSQFEGGFLTCPTSPPAGPTMPPAPHAVHAARIAAYGFGLEISNRLRRCPT